MAGSCRADVSGDDGGSSFPWIVVVQRPFVFYGAHRIRAPGEPTVVLLAAVALVMWWERSRVARTTTSDLATPVETPIARAGA